MKIAKWIILALYGVQLFPVVPGLLGDMYRGEMSLYVWSAYSKDVELHGINDARFVIYVYVLFYSAFIFLPYLIISAVYKPHPHDRGIILIFSLWFLITFLVFGDSIFLFLRTLPNFFMVIVWMALLYLVASFTSAVSALSSNTLFFCSAPCKSQPKIA